MVTIMAIALGIVSTM